MPVLKVLRGPASQPEFAIGSDRVILGRDPACDIRLAPDEISRRHAEIVRDGDRYCVRDLRSRNGTVLNYERLEPEKSYPLQDRDILQLCSFRFVFHDSPSSFWSTGSSDDDRMVRFVGGQAVDDDSEFTVELDSSSDSWMMRTTLDSENKFRAVAEIMQELRESISLDDVLTKVLDVLLRIFRQADCAVLALPETENGPIVPRVCKHRGRSGPTTATVSQPVIDHVLKTQTPMISEQVKGTPSSTAHSHSALRDACCVMCAPLLDCEGNSLGAVLLLAPIRRKPFANEDLDVMTTVAGQVSFAIERSQLLVRALEEAKLRQEMALAREIQMRLLPTSVPKLEGYNFFDYYAAARYVGGDYYDYLQLEDGRLAFLLGDVSGKGVPAAMLMGNLSSEIRVHLMNGLRPVDVVSRINQSLVERTPSDSFVTLVLGLLQPSTHQLQIVNAGHWPPLLRGHDGWVREVGAAQAGLALGIADGFPYEECSAQLGAGEALVVYSDGVIDAENLHRETFKVSGIHTILGDRQIPSTQVGQRLIDEVRQFVGDYPQMDDICLLTIARDDPTAEKPRGPEKG